MFLSVMNAYCGICGLDYKSVYDLKAINEAIPLDDILETNVMPDAPVDSEIGNFIKYTGETETTNYLDGHYYVSNGSSWVDQGTTQPAIITINITTRIPAPTIPNLKGFIFQWTGSTYGTYDTNTGSYTTSHFYSTDGEKWIDFGTAVNQQVPELLTAYIPEASNANGFCFKFIKAIQNHYYKATRVTRNRNCNTWQNYGTAVPTNADLYFENQTFPVFDKWVENLGLVKSTTQYIDSTHYNTIISALQNGSYVILPFPSTDAGIAGHAVVAFGVNSKGEVLYVNSAMMGRNALGDYRAGVCCARLQNITVTGGPYCIISEGATKTLLNKTIENTVGDINSFLEEML